MKFVEYQDVSKNRIREIHPNQVRINHDWYRYPVAISAYAMLTETDLAIDANTDCFQQLMSHTPAELMLIGRPAACIQFDAHWQRQVFTMNQQGVGLEQMTIDAAVRTFNILSTEDRSIWLILIEN